MRPLIRQQLIARTWHRCVSFTTLFASSALLCALGLLSLCKVHAQETPEAQKSPEDAVDSPGCLPNGEGYLRARIDGIFKAELNWGNAELECTGAVRPTDGGIRLRFTAASETGEQLVLVFGIANLREGRSATSVPVNVTVIREGTGEFYGTQGDDKCMLDQVQQSPLVGIPHRTRAYRVVGRGFCTEPARAIRGKGSVLISRFDFTGRIDFDSNDPTGNEPQVAMQ